MRKFQSWLLAHRMFVVVFVAAVFVATCFNNCGGYSAAKTTNTSSSLGITGPSGAPVIGGNGGTSPAPSPTPSPTPAPAPSPSPAPAPAPAPSPTPSPSPSPTPSPLSVSPASVTIEAFKVANFQISGGTPPYQISGSQVETFDHGMASITTSYSDKITAAGSYLLQAYFGGTLTAKVTDAAGATANFTFIQTGTIGVALAVADQNYVLNGSSYWNYYYTADPGQIPQHQLFDIQNSFAMFTSAPPSHTHAIYICDNGAPRQFLSTDPGCEGKNKLALLGYLYDAADSVPGFTLQDITRTYNDATGLHRIQPQSSPATDGFHFEATLGYAPPRIPTAWCNQYMKCL